jgi:hypothetical protein
VKGGDPVAKGKKKAAGKPKGIKDKMRAAFGEYIGKARKESDSCKACGKDYKNCECANG